MREPTPFLSPLFLRFLRRHLVLPSCPSPHAYKPIRSRALALSLSLSLSLFFARAFSLPASLFLFRSAPRYPQRLSRAAPTNARGRELPLSLLSTLGRAACSDARRAVSCCSNLSAPLAPLSAARAAHPRHIRRNRRAFFGIHQRGEQAVFEDQKRFSDKTFE